MANDEHGSSSVPLDAYLRTVVELEVDGRAFRVVPLRGAVETVEPVEATIPVHDFLADHFDARTIDVVTAWNPGSQELPRTENAERHTRLLDHLDTLGLSVRGRATGREPRETGRDLDAWSEEGVILSDVPLAQILALSREFGQYGWYRLSTTGWATMLGNVPGDVVAIDTPAVIAVDRPTT